jgi:hypothetical protein
MAIYLPGNLNISREPITYIPQIISIPAGITFTYYVATGNSNTGYNVPLATIPPTHKTVSQYEWSFPTGSVSTKTSTGSSTFVNITSSSTTSVSVRVRAKYSDNTYSDYSDTVQFYVKREYIDIDAAISNSSNSSDSPNWPNNYLIGSVTATGSNQFLVASVTFVAFRLNLVTGDVLDIGTHGTTVYTNAANNRTESIAQTATYVHIPKFLYHSYIPGNPARFMNKRNILRISDKDNKNHLYFSSNDSIIHVDKLYGNGYDYSTILFYLMHPST